MKLNGKHPDSGAKLKAFLIVCFGEKNRTTRAWAEEIFEEMKALCVTAGITIVNPARQADESSGGLYRLRRIDPRYYLSTGIVEQAAADAKSAEADLALVAFEMSPSQQSHLAEKLGLTVRSKTEIIYEIFLKRSSSAISKIQIELANLRYIKSRLVGSYEGMDRIRGGIGMRGGPGETKLETDRRTIGRKIASLRDELKKYEKHFDQLYSDRKDQAAVSIVGYTNAGKTSLLNALTKADEKAENLLFSTVEVRTRPMYVERGFSVLLSDTIGFIRDIPHHLVESFKTTLMEIRYAKLVMVVVDASSPFRDEHLRVTGKVLEELGCVSIPRITVYNKIDRLDPAAVRQADGKEAFVSTKTGDGLDGLKQMIVDFFRAAGYGDKTARSGGEKGAE